MIVDSHCHLNFIDLTDFNHDLSQVIKRARDNGVGHFLSVCVELTDYPQLEQLALEYKNISISVGVHPNTEMDTRVTAEILCDLAKNPACIAIGETGLDYYRAESEEIKEQQRDRFREHIKASIETSKPLIIHTRQAAEDTLLLMEKENAKQIGGVMHCFAEDLDIAQRAIELNFYISFSGIVTFKNAKSLQEVAKKIPLDRILIETDSPYLAPVPFRGKQNHPALVKEVALCIAELRGIDFETVAKVTTQNFANCFRVELG
ncbi:TatD family hydrolase [Legionella waltersii]|uniref:Deoxyribonuclease TatD n=1 Tax=Legionella waltersii TaxID=66969 RepID=A0A0W1ALS0_9GAMM|nr:TatD family hydrolase [Legionella waltersii]KTD82298.1 deoxyribonuclease TatD [Legionella waltersii]SNV04183.1 deoxyribonuclease TatD [Legionella waltersii]